MVELRDQPAELGAPEQRPGRDGAERPHPAPLVEPAERPHGELLQAEDVGPVGARQPHHLLEEAAPLRRVRVAVEDVPGADEQWHERASVSRCSADAALPM